MTEEKIKELEFEFIEKYLHDQFHTNKYRKEFLEVEFTYENEKLISCELTILKDTCIRATLKKIKELTRILNLKS